MKIYPCIAGDDITDSTEIRVGHQMEVAQIPRIGEKIKMNINLFDLIFKSVHSTHKDSILFTNAVTEGVVMDVVHRFQTMVRPITNQSHGKQHELLSEIGANSDFYLEQVIYVVIKFKKAGQ